MRRSFNVRERRSGGRAYVRRLRALVTLRDVVLDLRVAGRADDEREPSVQPAKRCRCSTATGFLLAFEQVARGQRSKGGRRSSLLRCPDAGGPHSWV
jgi:hypothetical protein